MLWPDMLHKSRAKELKGLRVLSVLFQRGDQIRLTLGHKEMLLLVAAAVDSQRLCELLDGRWIVLQTALVDDSDIRDETGDIWVPPTIGAEGVPAYLLSCLIVFESLVKGFCSRSSTRSCKESVQYSSDQPKALR